MVWNAYPGKVSRNLSSSMSYKILPSQPIEYHSLLAVEEETKMVQPEPDRSEKSENLGNAILVQTQRACSCKTRE